MKNWVQKCISTIDPYNLTYNKIHVEKYAYYGYIPALI